MDTSLIYGIGGVAIGLLLGWLIASLRAQQHGAQHETDLRLLEQSLQQAQLETASAKRRCKATNNCYGKTIWNCAPCTANWPPAGEAATAQPLAQ